MWWLWVVGGLATWLVVGFGVAVVLGRAIRLADQRERTEVPDVVPVPGGAAHAPPARPRARRRAVPLPAVGVALAAIAVALETSGFVLALTGSGSAARLLSMDAPGSLPRMFVAFLFAAAAVAAVSGAGRIRERRTWWLAVGLVAAVIAAVKAGSTVHVDAMRALASVAGRTGAVVISGLVAAAVLTGLWLITRTEQRDRRRVLSVLALYAVAAVGFSAVSSAVGSGWEVTATYVEESAEALAGVAFLVAVLIGVAPRLVLPAEWALRRAADAQTLDLPQQIPGRSTTEGPARG